MNSIAVRAVRTDGMFAGQFRRVHKAEFETVRINGCPVLFPTEDKAKLAAWEALTSHLCTLMRREGETVDADARKAAEAIFKGKPDGESKTQSP